MYCVSLCWQVFIQWYLWCIVSLSVGSCSSSDIYGVLSVSMLIVVLLVISVVYCVSLCWQEFSMDTPELSVMYCGSSHMISVVYRLCLCWYLFFQWYLWCIVCLYVGRCFRWTRRSCLWCTVVVHAWYLWCIVCLYVGRCSSSDIYGVLCVSMLAGIHPVISMVYCVSLCW